MAFSDSSRRHPGADSGPGEIAGQKRSSWEDNNLRGSKRRASRACLSCRSRKVRCDLVSGGHPCTNCRLDEIECVVKDSIRGRRPYNTSTTSTQTVPQSSQNDASSPRARTSSVLDTPSNQINSYLVPLTCEEDQQRRDPSEEASPIHDLPHDNHEHESCASPRDNGLSIPSLVPDQSHLHTLPQPDTSSHYLPPYIRPLPPHISDRDLSYLADKGALDIPDDAFRDELLRTYVRIIHPFMPTVDLEDFLVPILRGDGRNPVSLMLFQAVMFCSVSFIDSKLLQSRGYTSKKAARNLFFGRVRLLHGLDCEEDHLSLLQVTLLMTYWYDSPNDEKDAWYWMGIALSLAQGLGIHRETALCSRSFNNKRLKRRIWWSCVMRDRLIALGLRRPCRIRDGEFDVPQLTLDDFDLRVPSETIIHLLGESRFTDSDPLARSVMAAMCAELSKLCVCLGHILHSQYAAVSDQPVVSQHLLRVIVVPKRSMSQQQDLAKCEAELNEWLNSQNPHSKYIPSPHQTDDKNDKSSPIIGLHQALLYMIYLTAVSVLHKPQVLYAEGETTDGDALGKASREKVAKATVAITQLGFDLQMSNQLQYLSASSVPAFLSATMIHLLNIRSHDEEVRNISIGRFHQCMYTLQQLQDIHSAADYAIHFLEALLRNMDVNIPTLRPQFLSAKPSSNRNKPQLLRFERSTQGRTPLFTTAYPSPSSSSRNNEISGEEGSEENGNYFLNNNSVAQPTSSQNSQFDNWGELNGQFDRSQGLGDILPGASYMGDWVDLTNVVPALINLDSHSMPFDDPSALFYS